MEATLTKKSRSKPLVVRITGDWEQAMVVAIRRAPPKDGWSDVDDPATEPKRLGAAEEKPKKGASKVTK